MKQGVVETLQQEIYFTAITAKIRNFRYLLAILCI